MWGDINPLVLNYIYIYIYIYIYMYLTHSCHLNSGLLCFSAGFNSSTEGLVWIIKNICSRDECWNQLAQDGDQWWAFMEVIVQGSTVSQKARSHFQILGARTVTWSKFHTENQEFWSYLWLSLISGVCYSVHVNWFIPLYVRNKKPTLTLRRLMSYIYGAPILDVSRSHTTQHSR